MRFRITHTATGKTYGMSNSKFNSTGQAEAEFKRQQKLGFFPDGDITVKFANDLQPKPIVTAEGDHITLGA